MMISASININIEFDAAGQRAAFTRPLISITRPLITYWRLRARVQRCARRLHTMTTVASIGLACCKFALGV